MTPSRRRPSGVAGGRRYPDYLRSIGREKDLVGVRVSRALRPVASLLHQEVVLLVGDLTREADHHHDPENDEDEGKDPDVARSEVETDTLEHAR